MKYFNFSSIMNEDWNFHYFYKVKSKEWIFQKTYRNYFIEDDEILDLGSLSLDSNEDTWLYSKNEISPMGNGGLKTNAEDTARPSVESSRVMLEETNTNFESDAVENNFSFSSIIDFDDCSGSLIHLPDVSQATVDRYLFVTPVSEKPFPSHQNVAALNQLNNCRLDDEHNFSSSFDQINKSETFNESLSEVDSVTCREISSHLKCVDSNHVLYSVENEPFSVIEADSFDNSQFHARIRFRNQSIANDSQGRFKSENITLKACDTESQSMGREKEHINDCNSKTRLKKLHSFVQENNENDHDSASKKCRPFSQSTPMLLNRYLKYNKCIEDSKQFIKWRISHDFLKEDAMRPEKGDCEDDMNISYIKNSTCSNIPSENDSTLTEIGNNLNATYSKSDSNLNSAYVVQSYDDLSSSASESSTSWDASESSGCSHHIQHIPKKADLKNAVKMTDFSKFVEKLKVFKQLLKSGCKLSRIEQYKERKVDLENSLIEQKHINTEVLANEYLSPKNIHVLNKFHRNTECTSSTIGIRSTMTQPKENETRIIDNIWSIKKKDTFTPKFNVSVTVNKNQTSGLNTFIKSDELNTTAHSIPSITSASFSQIPRPSSKIPKLRTSHSYTHYSGNAANVSLRKYV